MMPRWICLTALALSGLALAVLALSVLALCGLPSVSAQAADIRISIDKMDYAPATVSAKVGDTIEWVNADILAHTATAKNNDWDVMIGANKTVRMVLRKPGEIDYYCKFHPNMKGHVTAAD
jgi:plastocyanin